jgi:pyruvate/2-oxoglutarate/acetoin dehydrogenase E1 component
MREITYREALSEAIREEMLRDPQVFIMGEDIADPLGGSFKVTLGMSTEFGTDRVRNTPISEAGFIGAALGAAMTGMRPIVELMYIDFTGICGDQIFNQIAKIRYMSGGQVKVPLVIRTKGGGGRSAATQHSQSLEAWYTHVPGLYVVMPSTPYDAKGLLKTAIRDDNPVVFIEHNFMYNVKGAVPTQEYTLPIGEADIKRSGKDVTVIATSLMVHKALDAAKALADQGIDVEVVDPRSLFPLDFNTILASVKKTRRVVVVHEACKTCGWGAEVAARITEEAFDYLDAPVQRVGALDVPIPFSPKMEQFVLPNADKITAAVRQTMA